MRIAIIPARGGSKRIPRKNIKNFNGIPMLERTIGIINKSEIFEHIIVSTDDSEIKEIAISSGAQVPFIRPKELADDYSPTMPVIKHAISALTRSLNSDDEVCCIYPCNPLLFSDDLYGTLRLLESHPDNFIFPVCEYPHPIQRSMYINDNGELEFVYPDFELTRTQDLKKTYYDVGQFYWGKVSSWQLHDKLHSTGIGYPVPQWRVVDIDNQTDWVRAELLSKLLDSGLERNNA